MTTEELKRIVFWNDLFTHGLLCLIVLFHIGLILLCMKLIFGGES